METNSRNRKEYSIAELVFGNLAIVLWIGLGAAVFSLFYFPSGVAFAAVAAFAIFYELGKHGCVSCYYCKTCTIGMGKLPELFFKQGGTANVNRKAMKLFPFVYILLSLVPIALLIFSLVQDLAVFKIGLLVGLIVFSTYTGFIQRKNLTSKT